MFFFYFIALGHIRAELRRGPIGPTPITNKVAKYFDTDRVNSYCPSLNNRVAVEIIFKVFGMLHLFTYSHKIISFYVKEMINILLFRELYGVAICKQDEIQTLKNITKQAIESEVCKLPCIANFLDLDNLGDISCLFLTSHSCFLNNIVFHN